MAPKSFLLMAILMASLLLLYIDVAFANHHQPENPHELQAEDAVGESKQRSCGRGYCCGGWSNGYCRRCCYSKAEVSDATEESDLVGDQKQYGCRYGCCGGWWNGRCRRCCASKAEAASTVASAKNDHDHVGEEKQSGGGCGHGCCGGWWHGRCRRCCKSKDEVPDAAGAEETQN